MSTQFSIPRSVSVNAELVPQLAVFERPIRSFVVHNAKPTPVETMFGGNMMTVPAVDQYHPTKCAVDADGERIPGTYVISDIWTYLDGLGDYELTFNAERAVRHVLGIPNVGPREPGAKAAAPAPIQLTSEFAMRGLSLLPLNAPKSLWRAVADAGEKRAFLAAVASARVLVKSYQVAWDKAKAAGVEAAPPGVDYEYAVTLIRKYNEIVGAEQEERTAKSPWREEAEMAQLQTEIEIEAEIKAVAMQVAANVSAKTKVSKEQLFEDLMKDPDVRKLAMKKYRFRKKGHQDLGGGAEVEFDASAAGLGADAGDHDADEND